MPAAVIIKLIIKLVRQAVIYIKSVRDMNAKLFCRLYELALEAVLCDICWFIFFVNSRDISPVIGNSPFPPQNVSGAVNLFPGSPAVFGTSDVGKVSRCGLTGAPQSLW